MKNLILIRHAKSSWDLPIEDFKREITLSGKEKTIKVAHKTIDDVNSDAIIWCSYATRTQQTAKIFLENWHLNQNLIEIKKELYTFDASKLEEIVKSCLNDCQKLILFGHNSAITDFVNKFGDIYIENVPTSGFVSIIFDCDNWSDIKKGKTNKIIVPRDI
ncbi:SixA phosphatase family protein [Flavobacterium sp.]|uniref:SixA phosphatase family protein n=1 Tax=Flavobacterium sp. TaxID=239 RepID=UPI00375335F5